MRAMTAPLLTLQFDLESRAFALRNRAARALDQRLDLHARYRGQCRVREDGDEGFEVLRVHDEYESAI